MKSCKQNPQRKFDFKMGITTAIKRFANFLKFAILIFVSFVMMVPAANSNDLSYEEFRLFTKAVKTEKIETYFVDGRTGKCSLLSHQADSYPNFRKKQDKIKFSDGKDEIEVQLNHKSGRFLAITKLKILSGKQDYQRYCPSELRKDGRLDVLKRSKNGVPLVLASANDTNQCAILSCTPLGYSCVKRYPESFAMGYIALTQKVAGFVSKKLDGVGC